MQHSLWGLSYLFDLLMQFTEPTVQARIVRRLEMVTLRERGISRNSLESGSWGWRLMQRPRDLGTLSRC